MGDTLTENSEGEEKVQTTNWVVQAVKAVDGKHNPKVGGSNPPPAI
jgi:hypothetical protein